MKYLPLVLLIVAVGLTGCENPVKTATITGRVTDEEGLPVRDAVVQSGDATTRTTTNGTYVLPGNRQGEVEVIATYEEGTSRYRGATFARTVDFQTTLSANLTLFPTSRLANIRGVVRDRDGFLLSGVNVFAFNESYLSSARAVTNSNGEYTLSYLGSNITYSLSAGGRNYQNDEATVILNSGETRVFNFILDDAGVPSLPAPANLTHITWVSPRTTRSQGDQAAYENIKRLFDPGREARLSSRASTAGNPIEVEINWDRLQGLDFYGYGIYRGIGTSNPITSHDFYREPMAGTYIDTDPNLNPGSTYRYQLTALGTSFPNDPDSEGPRSSIVEARTLDDLQANSASVAGNTITFNWSSGSGSTSYVVYIFDSFPGLGVSSIINNQSSPATGNSVALNGSGLVRGRTYYYLVLGLANSNRSRTISQVRQFTY